MPLSSTIHKIVSFCFCKAIEIFPNPFHQKLKLRFNGLTKAEPVEIFIRDVTGKIILTQHLIAKNNVAIFLAASDNLPAGIYSIELKTAQTVFSKKIVKL